MKCELCHKAEAREVLRSNENGDTDELYVCPACAKHEREKHQRKSQRTRKVTGLPPGISMSITEISRSSEDGSDDGASELGAIMNAFSDMVSDIVSAKRSEKSEKAAPKLSEFPIGRVAADYRVRGALHLEGLHLIGELESTRRAIRALGMELVGTNADGVCDVGHVYSVRYSGSIERAKRVVQDLLREEKNARVRLREEMPRVLGDAFCRALAILKNCRLLSSGELFDILSPMRLAARERLLDGITLREIEKMMDEQDLSNSEDALSQAERDRVDAERADGMNRRFEEVMLNDVL